MLYTSFSGFVLHLVFTMKFNIEVYLFINTGSLLEWCSYYIFSAFWDKTCYYFLQHELCTYFQSPSVKIKMNVGKYVTLSKPKNGP
jgi:hypothetical protein